MTRQEIEQFNEVEPYCFETDREKRWYRVGLQEGLSIADENPKSPWISVKDDLPCNHKELMVKDENGRWETKRVLVRIQETDISSRSPYFADCMMSKWDGEENGFLWHLCSQGYITHWMPIPKLTEE